MHSSSAGWNKTPLLVALLLLTCYAADWSDDELSYWTSNRARTFAIANGERQLQSGGSFDTARMFMDAGAFRAAQSGKGTQVAVSALESVFGSPMGTQSASTDGSSRSSTSTDNGRAQNSLAAALSGQARSSGLSTSGSGMGYGASGLGLSGGGVGLSGGGLGLSGMVSPR